MRTAFPFFLLCSLVLLSCTETSQLKSEELNYLDFQKKLSMGMDFNAIVSTFGNPARDAGSGIHIYVYQLNDLSEIWIGFVDHILYARHMDKNQQFLENIKFLNSMAVITGPDARMCACCGGWFVLINGISYEFDALPAGSPLDLQQVKFPMTVHLDWQVSDQTSCPNDKILLQRISVSAN